MRLPTLPRYFVSALLLLGSLLISTGAAAQTTLLDVPGPGGTKLFQLNDDASLLVKGTFGVGAIPATGPGMRLMWYPRRAAFRAGSVLLNAWDDAKIGNYSVAMGFNTMASQPYTTALGQSTLASGQASTALGNGAMAIGDYATAMGSFTTAGGIASTAMGEETMALGDWSTAMGYYTEAGTEVAGKYSTAMGYRTIAGGQASTAMGWSTEAAGDYATAMGQNTLASSFGSTVMGFNTQAYGLQATAMGAGTQANGSYSTVMGFSTTAQAYISVVLGRHNIIAGNPTSWDQDDPILVVGNGSDNSNRSNAFTLLKDGSLTIAGGLFEFSDRRLKTDIHFLTNALDGLARLQPVRFRFREGTNRPEGAHIGLIAQEVQAVFPELVQQGADGYLSVSYTNLSAVLVQALNEQQAEVEALRAEIASLRTANITMQDRLARLEAVSH